MFVKGWGVRMCVEWILGKNRVDFSIKNLI